MRGFFVSVFHLFMVVGLFTPPLSAQRSEEAGRPFLTSFTAREFGGDLQTWAFVQDRRGVMYIGNSPGVIEYDGVSWRMIETANGTFVRSLDIDANGRIYVGSSADFGYLAPDSLGDMKFVSLLEFVDEADRVFGYTWTTHATDDGVFFQTHERLFRFRLPDDATPETDPRPSDWKVDVWKPAAAAFNFAFWVNGTYYVMERGSGLKQMIGDSLRLLPGGDQFANDRLQVMLTIGDPRPDTRVPDLLIGTFNRGLFRFDGNGFRPFPTEADPFLKSQTLYDGVTMPDGTYGLGTINGGFVQVDDRGNTLRYITQGDGLASNSILSVFVDRQGILWIGPENGISLVETPSPLSIYNASSGLESAPMTITRHEGIIYVGTSNGVFYLDRAQSRFRPLAGLAPGNTQCFAVVSIDSELLMAVGTGLYRLNNGRAEAVKMAGGLEFSPHAIHRSRQDPDRIFVSLFDGLATFRRDASAPAGWKFEGRIEDIGEYLVEIAEPEPGTFWLSTTDRGILRLQMPEGRFGATTIDRFDSRHGLGSDGGVNVFIIAGAPLFVTPEGLFRFDDARQRFYRDTTFEIVGLSSTVLSHTGSVREDEHGNVWLNLGAETAFLRRRSDGSYDKETTPFLRFSDETVALIYPEADGTVWFGINDGIIRYDPTIPKDYSAAFATVIRRVTSGTDAVLFSGTLTGVDTTRGGDRPLPVSRGATDRMRLGSHHNTLQFEYAAPTFENPRATRYQSMLEGFDRDWSAWSAENKRNYTNLPPGDYRFRVRARNVYNTVGKEGMYAFTLLPPWYRTGWAYFLYLLTALAFVVGLVKNRTRHLEAQRRELEQTVQDRTHELSQRVDELRVINSVQEGLVAQIDMQGIYELVGEQIRVMFDAQVTVIATLDARANEEHFEYAFEKGKRYTVPPRPITGFRTHLIAHRRPILINENFAEAQQGYGGPKVVAGEMPKSVLFVPLLVGETVRGYISLQNIDRENAFGESDVRLLTTLANSMSVALENARLFDHTKQLLDETEQRNAELAVINSVQEGLVAQIDMQGIYELVGEQIRSIFDSQVAIIATFDHPAKVEHFQYHYEMGEKRKSEPREISGIRNHLIQHRQLIVLNENLLEQIPRYGGSNVIPGTDVPKSAVWVPLTVGDTVKGYISLQNIDRENAFSDSDVRLLSTLANSMSVALENARLFDETNRLLEETEQRNNELAVINGVQDGLVRELDIQAIYDLVGNRIHSLFDIQTVIIRTFDHEAGTETWQFAIEKGERLQVDPRPINWANRELIRSRSPILINRNYVETAQQYGGKGVTVGDPPKSAAFVPLIVGDTVRGSISLQNIDRENAFSDSDVRLLTTLSNSMSVALENARLFNEANQRATELATVNDISKALVSELEVDALIHHVGEKMRDTFGADIVYLALLDSDGERINFPYCFGEQLEPIPLGEGLTSKIIQTGESLLMNREVQKQRAEMGVDIIGVPAASYLGVPISVGGRNIGVISVQSTTSENRFTESDERLLTTIAANVGVALHNATLFTEAQEARAAAEEANDAKSAFLSTVSHELRTPLTSVLGFAKIIKKRLDEKLFPLLHSEDRKIQRTIDQVAGNLNVVVSEGERLTTLINNVLDLAKIEAGKIEWHEERIDIVEILARAIAATDSLFTGTPVSLKREIPPSLPTMVGDADKLIQVVINLISNAAKFTEKGTVTCAAAEQNGDIVVRIIDTGMGIAPEDQASVFEKFRQVGDTLTDKPKGTGLGLTICREIVEYHGGRIWVESEPGKGSTFAFSLPLNRADADGLQLPQLDFNSLMSQLKQRVQTTALPPREGQPVILVVDDDASIRNYLSQELGEAGYEVQTAADGRAAIEAIRTRRPDLVILDVMMPEMNGFDVAAVLKNDPQTMDIPILILSIVEDRERGFRLGIDRYLTKPIDTEALFREVDRLLEQGTSHRKVMVVDENASTVRTLIEVLETRGYQVVEADGTELLKKATAEKPDIIILNAMVDGKQELVKALRFEKGMEDVLFLVYQ